MSVAVSPAVPLLSPSPRRHPLAVLVAGALLATAPLALSTEAQAGNQNRAFQRLQTSLRKRPASVKPGLRRTRVVVPSLSVDGRELAKISGARHYEERQLYELLALKDPDLKVVFTSSTRIDRAVIDYYMSLLPRAVRRSARARLTLVSADDPSPSPLTEKLLARPDLQGAIRKAVRPSRAHVHPFVTSRAERTLALRLRVPLLGTDPALARWGGKSGSREIFEAAGVRHPAGVRDIRDADHMVRAISDLVARRPGARRLVLKLNDGFSGEGNAILDLRDQGDLARLPAGERARRIASLLPELEFTAPDERWANYRDRIAEMGAVVEEFVEGEDKRSPSVQGFIGPDGQVEILSTHEQLLGGRDNQVYLGARFPAEAPYRRQLEAMGRAVGAQLASKGAMGRFAVDAIAARRAGGGEWELHALEINLRQGGTTHPYETTRLLTGARYDEGKGLLIAPSGRAVYYVATDNVKLPGLVGLSPAQLLGRARRAGLVYDRAGQKGPVFHLLGAVTEHGKLGFTAIADSPAEAEAIYQRTMGTLRRIAERR